MAGARHCRDHPIQDRPGRIPLGRSDDEAGRPFRHALRRGDAPSMAERTASNSDNRRVRRHSKVLFIASMWRPRIHTESPTKNTYLDIRGNKLAIYIRPLWRVLFLMEKPLWLARSSGVFAKFDETVALLPHQRRTHEVARNDNMN